MLWLRQYVMYVDITRTPRLRRCMSDELKSMAHSLRTAGPGNALMEGRGVGSSFLTEGRGVRISLTTVKNEDLTPILEVNATQMCLKRVGYHERKAQRVLPSN